MLLAAGGLLVTFLAAVVPWRGRERYRRFRAATDEDARSRYFRASLKFKWLIAVYATVLYAFEARAGHGLPWLPRNGAAFGVAVLLLAAVGVGALRMQRVLASSRRRPRFERAVRRFSALIPRTPDERRLWVAVSWTAGITEELVYRAFAISWVAHIFGNDNSVAWLLIPAVLFGLAHLYQGPRNVVLTGIVGIAFALLAVSAGLLLAMVVHALMDLRILLIPPEFAETADG
jgi:membrane protease YdiL (CAAX protease family)